MLLFLEKLKQDVIGTSRETKTGSFFIAIIRLNKCQIFLLMFIYQWKKTFPSLNKFVAWIIYRKYDGIHPISQGY